MGRLQRVCKLGVHVQELCAAVPHCTIHDGTWGHLRGVDLQALRAEGGQGALAISSLSPQQSPEGPPPNQTSVSSLAIRDSWVQNNVTMHVNSRCFIHA